MSKIKAKRQSISLDMTAMCDMAFLLLTFFILTAKMKTPEPAQFDIPASVSKKKLPEEGVLRISISKVGGVYLTLADQSLKREMINLYCKTYKLDLSEDAKQKFELLETWGMPSASLPTFLGASDSQRKRLPQVGIPVDSTNNELKKWVAVAKTIDKDLAIAIKGDKETEYTRFQTVIDAMRDLNLKHFSLITNLESAPKQD